MNRIAFALIGAGVIGEVHARNIAARPDALLRWVVDVDPARGRALAAAHGAVFSTSVDEMLTDPDVRIVVIGPFTAPPQVTLLASGGGGKNCPSAGGAANAIAGVGFNRRFDVNHRAVHERVRAGEIGKVESVHIVSRSFEASAPAAAHRAGGLLRE